MITYEINPSSGPVIVERGLDIRPAVYNKGNVKSGYKLPDELKGRRFVRQLGLVTKGGKVYACVQPPGTYTPDFGYGPITGRIVVHPQEIGLEGNYDRFPDLPRTKTIFVREITQDGMRPVSAEAFNLLNSHAKSGPLTEELVGELMHDTAFCQALADVFEKAGFRAGFCVKDKRERYVNQHANMKRALHDCA